MKVLFISIDSLRRDFLGTYQDLPSIVDYDVETSNIDAFAEKAITFENHYAGSLPCMPARREWLTGTQEFLWRPWGPIEPFDETLPQMMRKNNILSQLVTDHYHLFQHGSHGYFEDYNGFEFIRGHEYDALHTAPKYPDNALLSQTADSATDRPDSVQFKNRSQYARNIEDFTEVADFFSPKVFSKVADWLGENQEWDNWFCQVDSFDVHEPFHIPEQYTSMYTDEDPKDPDLPVWPYYGPIDEGQSKLSERQLQFLRSQFSGKITMVDEWFGRVLDALDENELWDETMVIVTSDHGFFLGEEGYVGKNQFPVLDLLAKTPLLIWHPECSDDGRRVGELTSAVDLYATILDVFGVDHNSPHSQSLLPVLDGTIESHREWALYGYWGSAMNITDGQYTYHRPCDTTQPTECYSTTMLNPHKWLQPAEPKNDATAGAFLPYTETPVWKFTGESFTQLEESLLFDISKDPHQEQNIIEEQSKQGERMKDLMVSALETLEAPQNQFSRLNLEPTNIQ